ncbi:response regulator transcription factor [Shinella zoogloeoides]
MFVPEAAQLDHACPTDRVDEPARIAIVARPDCLVECLAEALRRRFHDGEVIIGDSRDAEGRGADLILYYRRDPAEIARTECAKRAAFRVPVAVIVDDSFGIDPVLEGMARERHIDGILPLSMHLDILLASLDLLLKGGEYFPSALLHRRRGEHEEQTRGGEIVMDYSHLTARETDILQLLCKGTQNKLIAHRLHLSENTVKAHIRSIYRKLHVTNRTAAVMSYRREGR